MNKDLKVKAVYPYERKEDYKLPLYTTKVPAGFPSPADDYIESKLDLNKFLVKHPSATFFVRVEGESMKDAGIYPNDILIVDRAVEPKANHVVIAAVNGELTVKRIYVSRKKLFLIPQNPQYKPMEITKDMDFEIWGVVTHVLHKV
ncbi:MAG: LexA family protein [Patescibacteria group bacterium]|jgi:DNA polymerase V